jgi:uncharacterized membrane protein
LIRCSLTTAIAKLLTTRLSSLSQTTTAARQFLAAGLFPSAISLAGLYYLVAGSLTEFLCCGVISVGDSSTMAHVMFPLPLAALTDLLAKFAAINVPIEIDILVNVDVDVSATPVAAAPSVSPCNAEPNTYPKSK